MKVLYVSSGNNKTGISPIVKAQGESLRKAGIDIEYFTVVGKGYEGYAKSIVKLWKYLNTNRYDIIHSHFFLSSVVATSANPRKLVVSLMGSDVYYSKFWNVLIRKFSNRWDALIVKSDRMKQILGIENVYVIPNGVDTALFQTIDSKIARKEIGWDETKKYVLFASQPGRPEKNFELAEESVAKLKAGFNVVVELVTIKDIPQEKIFYFLNACDLLLMTSKYEGSPNIIKEAMACNCPIVSTDVGDVRWVIGDTEGCFLISKKKKVKSKKLDQDLIEETSEKLKEALEFAHKIGRTKGRDRIIELGLDSKIIAQKIFSIYQKVLDQNE